MNGREHGKWHGCDKQIRACVREESKGAKYTWKVMIREGHAFKRKEGKGARQGAGPQ